jgi:AraC-like DNA-binding protein
MAKEIIIKRMTDPPSLKELSSEVDISLKNLKEGFKEIYGYTVYGFLLEYKMNIASKMLSTKNYNVNEVADQIGYSTSSHFINALKTDLVQHLINILSLFKAYFQLSFLHYLYNHLRILLDDNFQ